MSNETTLTIVGNLTADPQLSFVGSGDAVARFTVASTPRRFDRQAGQWSDGETLFLRCSAWRQLAENVADSTVTKGARVIVCGRLRASSWETPDGDKRTSLDLEVDEIGPSLRFATARVTKTDRQQASTAPTPAASGQSVPSGGSGEEPPF